MTHAAILSSLFRNRISFYGAPAHFENRRGHVQVMTVVISMLRGVNVGGHNKIKMDALRALYESLKFEDVATFIQSGNVVFRTKERDLAKASRRIGDGIEKTFGFRPGVVLRTVK